MENGIALFVSTIHILRCYSPNGSYMTSMQLHGFSDVSEEAYAGVVYLRLVDSKGNIHVHTSLVISKTRLSPIKHLSICKAQVLTKLLCHAKKTLNIPVAAVFGWTDSTIVIRWLTGNPHWLKTNVGNQISFIIDQLPPD